MRAFAARPLSIALAVVALVLAAAGDGAAKDKP